MFLVTKLGKLFEKFEEKQKTNLLQIIAKRIIINPQGEILGYELNSPFSHLDTLASPQKGTNKEGGGLELVRYGSPNRSIQFLICCAATITLQKLSIGQSYGTGWSDFLFTNDEINKKNMTAI